MKKQYKVTLTAEERTQLEEIVSQGTNNAQKIKHANILLAVDETVPSKISDVEIAKRFHCHAKTVYNIRERFVEQGLAAALERKKRETPPPPPIFDGRAEARLIALACSTPPEGRAAWTMQLLADKCVELEIVEKTSDETVRKALKKTNLNRISKSVG
jgi:transposase